MEASTAAPAAAPLVKGLEGVIADVSSISDVRGREGRLIYRGYDVHELVRWSTFEETTYLLWYGSLPTRDQLQEFTNDLSQCRDLPDPAWEILKGLPRDRHLMDTLGTAVSILALFNPDAGDTALPARHRQALQLVGRMGTVTANLARLYEGKDVVRPQPGLTAAANFLAIYFDRAPDDDLVRILDQAFVLHADHEFNASTFAGRIAASTLSDLYAVLVVCLAVLKGPLHGGAGERVMGMLEEIGEPDRAEAWVKERLARKEKIMGFGHRVYRTDDPRATHLRQFSKDLGQRTGETRWYDISRRIEDVVLQEKGLYPNVDFYSASVYRSMGLPTYLYTPLFACSRVAGYTAHALEQYADNRLIRPRSSYIGPEDRGYVPIEFRK